MVILDLVIERGLVGRLAGTPLYSALFERLLSLSADSSSSQQQQGLLEHVAQQLALHGHRSHAGHLLQLTNAYPRYLLNFTSSLFFAPRKS